MRRSSLGPISGPGPALWTAVALAGCSGAERDLRRQVGREKSEALGRVSAELNRIDPAQQPR